MYACQRIMDTMEGQELKIEDLQYALQFDEAVKSTLLQRDSHLREAMVGDG